MHDREADRGGGGRGGHGEEAAASPGGHPGAGAPRQGATWVSTFPWYRYRKVLRSRPPFGGSHLLLSAAAAPAKSFH